MKAENQWLTLNNADGSRSTMPITRTRGGLGFEPDRAGARIHTDEPKRKTPELLREIEGTNAEVTSMMAEIHGLIVDEQAITPFSES